jgi:hypothetical protein
MKKGMLTERERYWINYYKEVNKMAMSQTIEDVIEEILTEVNGDDQTFDRIHKLDVDSVKWEGDVAKVTVDCPDIGLYPTSLFLNAEQSAKLRDPKEKNQVYELTLALGKLKQGKSGDNAYDYWYQCKSFEGVVNERIRSMSPSQVSVAPPAPVTTSIPEFSEAPATSAGDRKQKEINLGQAWNLANTWLEKRVYQSEDVQWLGGNSEDRVELAKHIGVLAVAIYKEMQKAREEVGLV